MGLMMYLDCVYIQENRSQLVARDANLRNIELFVAVHVNTLTQRGITAGSICL